MLSEYSFCSEKILERLYRKIIAIQVALTNKNQDLRIENFKRTTSPRRLFFFGGGGVRGIQKARLKISSGFEVIKRA